VPEVGNTPSGIDWQVRLRAPSRRDAKSLERRVLESGYVATREGGSVLLYAATDEDASKLGEAVRPLAHPGTEIKIERAFWLPYQNWQVRLRVGNRDQVGEIRRRLGKAGFSSVRRWNSVLMGARTHEEAWRLAERARRLALPVKTIEVERASRIWVVLAALGEREPGPVG
jgi:hypothetical protein